MNPDMFELIKVVGAPSVLLVILGFGWFRYAQYQNKQIFDLFCNHVHDMGENIKASILQISAEFKQNAEDQQDVVKANTEELRILREKISEMVVELRHLNGRGK